MNWKSIAGLTATTLSIGTAVIASFAALGNHLYICFTDEKYILLVAGVIVPFVGVIHGAGAYFGWWA